MNKIIIVLYLIKWLRELIECRMKYMEQFNLKIKFNNNLKKQIFLNINIKSFKILLKEINLLII